MVVDEYFERGFWGWGWVGEGECGVEEGVGVCEGADWV